MSLLSLKINNLSKVRRFVWVKAQGLVVEHKESNLANAECLWGLPFESDARNGVANLYAVGKSVIT